MDYNFLFQDISTFQDYKAPNVGTKKSQIFFFVERFVDWGQAAQRLSPMSYSWGYTIPMYFELRCALSHRPTSTPQRREADKIVHSRQPIIVLIKYVLISIPSFSSFPFSKIDSVARLSTWIH